MREKCRRFTSHKSSLSSNIYPFLYSNNAVSFLGDTKTMFVHRFQKQALFCSWDSCTFSQTMKVAFKLRLYIWSVNFFKIGCICVWCCEFFLYFWPCHYSNLKKLWKIRSFCIILKNIFVCLLDFMKASLLQRWERKICKSLTKTAYNTLKPLFLKLPLFISGFWEKKKRAFLFSVFFFVVYKKKTTVMRLIANYFCTHTWKTCWYCEYNIIKFHYEITTTIKVSSEILVQE